MRWQRFGLATLMAAGIAGAVNMSAAARRSSRRCSHRRRHSRRRRSRHRRSRQPTQQPPTTNPDDPFAGRGAGAGRGRGTPPPPPPAPPAVMPAPVKPIVSATAPTPDPRVGLKPGYWDAAQAAWNLRMVSTTPSGEKFRGVTNSDLAFTGKYVVQGNYNGFQVFDITNPAKPVAVLDYVCPASQSDVSVYNNLLFVSGEGQTGRDRLRHPGRAGAGESGSPARDPRLRHLRHQESEVRSPTSRPAAVRTRTPW